jgi:hypothetical protein
VLTYQGIYFKKVIAGQPFLLEVSPMLFLFTNIVLVISNVGPFLPQQDTTEREVIATLYGKPIYRDEIEQDKNTTPGKSLQQKICNELFQRYMEKNAEKLKLSDSEIEKVLSYFQEKHEKTLADETPKLQKQLENIELELKDLSPDSPRYKTLAANKANVEFALNRPAPDKMFVKFLLGNWKHQKLLYETYNGGRLLWQQFGIEAFDATLTFLETEEKAGNFSIHNEKLRSEFYHYWKTQNHGPFLLDDPERIRTEFLEPEWYRN